MIVLIYRHQSLVYLAHKKWVMLTFPNDLEIAQAASIQHIKTIASRLGIDEDDLEYYGKYKAKLPLSLINEEKIKAHHLILVTAITPTPPGEGKPL